MKINKSQKRIQFENKMLNTLVTDLYWEYDRMSSSGQKTLDNLAKLIGVPTEEEMEKL
jgi:hypothetical protein|tara:strand:- start:3905 stop:4078 length:174 start_codon:yes stop_codon:yes gene_type:complete